MQSILASCKARAISKQIQREKERIIDSFARNPSGEHRAVTKVTKSILLNDPYLFHGKYWEVKAKSLGAGVYELSLEEQRKE